MLSQAYQWKPITLKEGHQLRALAILVILCHNFMHWISDMPGENEFTFRPQRWQAFLDGMWDTPWDFVRLLASYFGHYGVQVFFFLSGYGVVRKYGAKPPNWWAFQKSRWRALYPAIIAAAFGYLVYESFRIGFWQVIQTQGVNLLRQSLGISNFIPDNVYHPIGPWWFIGAILQFYLLVPLLLRNLQNKGEKILIILAASCLLIELLFADLLQSGIGLNINHSILGQLDVCLMGMWFAKRDHFSLRSSAMVVAFLVFIASGWIASIWIFSGLLLLIFLIPALRLFCRFASRSEPLSVALMVVGSHSLWLFLCNGYLRRPLISIPKEAQHWWTSLWTCFVFFILVFVWSLVLKAITQKITSNLSSHN